jgi:hypothetical protein
MREMVATALMRLGLPLRRSARPHLLQYRSTI